MVNEKQMSKASSSYQKDINRLKKKILFYEEVLERRNKQIQILKQECHQWKETCEILADPNIIKSITKSLKQFAEGKGIKLSELAKVQGR
ncbi:hypothetical protein LCGC14_2051890 [marine sediment metagenome]|uniref:Uncharacterized protein n=1 Tax=marine sediment metagenome TaxID=412755 RepID=A0A0F9FB33_9ZZZZ